MLYNVLPLGKKTPKIASSPWDFVTPPEEDRAMTIGNMHKKLLKIARVVRQICSLTDSHSHRRAYYNTSTTEIRCHLSQGDSQHRRCVCQ